MATTPWASPTSAFADQDPVWDVSPGLSADFNNDGTVNAQDFNLQHGNFGALGAGNTCP